MTIEKYFILLTNENNRVIYIQRMLLIQYQPNFVKYSYIGNILIKKKKVFLVRRHTPTLTYFFYSFQTIINIFNQQKYFYETIVKLNLFLQITNVFIRKYISSINQNMYNLQLSFSFFVIDMTIFQQKFQIRCVKQVEVGIHFFYYSYDYVISFHMTMQQVFNRSLKQYTLCYYGYDLQVFMPSLKLQVTCVKSHLQFQKYQSCSL
eukprot:TRINITY_DN11519_c0_g1_i12.p2 TRINITY_DN11519_c0_g1~~TRINITY_DN11519_c0_g1_i12.p2  ORF type:complete len:206 (-),score=-31.91 TRINITY_DN11519_c0_g1_i12:196-813(-)